MNIAIEKEMIINRFNEIQDADLIQAIKNLLDFGQGKQIHHQEDFVTALKEGINQSDNGMVEPHKQVWSEIIPVSIHFSAYS